MFSIKSKAMSNWCQWFTWFPSFKTMCVFVLPRLEQPYLNANASFFEALSCCSRLQRLCLISRRGTFDPSATETFMEQCCHVIMCHMFMGGTLVACRSLEKALLDRSVFAVVGTCCTSEVKRQMKSESFSLLRFADQRSALSVVIYPLQHEDLPPVIRGIPLTLLDRITLFQSHVAQPPHLSPLWHHQNAAVGLVLSWGAIFCRK